MPQPGRDPRRHRTRCRVARPNGLRDHTGFSQLEFVDIDQIKSAADDVDSALDDLPEDADADNARSYVDNVRYEADSVGDNVEDAKGSLESFMAFVKTFKESEFSTIYCEREWRSVETYRFSLDDVAMIVLPRKIGKQSYFENFIRKVIPRLKMPPIIPVVPWEDLVEH